MAEKKIGIKKSNEPQFPIDFLCEEYGLTGYRKDVFIATEKLNPENTITRKEFEGIYKKRFGSLPQL